MTAAWARLNPAQFGDLEGYLMRRNPSTLVFLQGNPHSSNGAEPSAGSSIGRPGETSSMPSTAYIPIASSDYRLRNNNSVGSTRVA
jgi:hypothetical protein